MKKLALNSFILLTAAAMLEFAAGCGSVNTPYSANTQASNGTSTSGTNNSGGSGSSNSGSSTGSGTTNSGGSNSGSNSGSGTDNSGSGGSNNSGSNSGSGNSGSTNSGSGNGGSTTSGNGCSTSGTGGSTGTDGGDGSYPMDVPRDAVLISGIQTLSTWTAEYDTGTSGSKGSSTGATAVEPDPSTSGNSRKFYTTYTNAGGERYHVDFGKDANAQNFFYDVLVYLPSAQPNVGNLEFDMNQVMPNGQTVIYGFQCDGYSGTWDYTENQGTATKPDNHWVHSDQKCNVANWAPQTWHHLQVSYSRDDEGNVTYKSVWLDGTEQQINGTVNSASALKWGAGSLLTNFQVDGRGNSGAATVYLDEMKVYRW